MVAPPGAGGGGMSEGDGKTRSKKVRQPKQRMNFAKFILLSLLGLAGFVFVVLSVTLDAHKVVWYELFPYVRPIKMDIRLTVDGNPIQLKGIGQCEWNQRLKPVFPDIQDSGWKTRGGVLAARLPNGGSVVVLRSVPCGGGNPSEMRGDTRFGETAPIILLADDAENPKVIEKIVSDDYFKHPAARVHYHGGPYRSKRRSALAEGAGGGENESLGGALSPSNSRRCMVAR